MNKLIQIIGSAVVIGGITIGILYNVPDDTPINHAPTQGGDASTVFKLIEQADEKLSNKTATNGTWKDKDLNGKIIYNSVFSREIHEGTTSFYDIFPSDMQGAIFICSHLDNIIIPQGNTVINEIDGTGCGSRKFYKVQNDGEDWIIDIDTKKPVEPILKEKFIEYGISVKPADIPKKKLAEPITTTKLKESTQ